MIDLGVNIDHVATLRQQRHTRYPDPIAAALRAEEAGADLITLHLREDRRHIQDADVFALRPLLRTRMNLECAVTAEMLAIACKVLPQDVCLVPEKRTELERGGHDCLCVGFLGDIAMHIALPKIRGERLAGLILDVGEHDASAGLRQHAGGTRAKARSAPGNDEYFICDFHGDPNG